MWSFFGQCTYNAAEFLYGLLSKVLKRAIQVVSFDSAYSCEMHPPATTPTTLEITIVYGCLYSCCVWQHISCHLLDLPWSFPLFSSKSHTHCFYTNPWIPSSPLPVLSSSFPTVTHQGTVWSPRCLFLTLLATVVFNLLPVICYVEEGVVDIG